MKQVSLYRIPALLAVICLSAALLLLAACGGSGDSVPSPTPEPPASPTSAPATLSPTATEAPPATPSPTATEAPSPTPQVSTGPRKIGEYEGVNFFVSEGSEATFTVEEKLVRLPLPNDAVMRTTALSGKVHLDGRPSTVQIDLHQLTSDQAFRDRYVRTRMFPDAQYAIFTVSGDEPVPEGLALGEEVTAEVPGSLQVRGVTVPIVFDVEARDDGEFMFIVGRTTFTWDQLNIPTPQAPVVASIEDEVRVEVLLALVPEEP